MWVRLGLSLLAAVPGVIVGLVLGLWDPLPWLPFSVPHIEPIHIGPLPHHVPKYKGAVTLRYAMVHDVLHERFPAHGTAYYAERNRQVRQQLAKVGPSDKWDERLFGLADDLAVGLDKLGEHDEAVQVLRDKLRRQQDQGLQGRALYTTYANLGTSLLHGSYPRALRGDEAAKGSFCEGLSLIHMAIDVNPQAHFGREIWQAATAEFLLIALDAPQVLLDFDLVGDRFDLVGDRLDTAAPGGGSDHDRWGWGWAIDRYRQELREPDESASDSDLYRSHITPIGAEEGWNARTSVKVPVAFDEPVLGIIGMWRLGGGANPHFALALGEIMLRVNQRHIAWCAYERAADMAERFSPDAAIRAKFVAHCRGRQTAIESQLPDADRAALRPRFRAELAYGRSYQQAYQKYEADRIAAGASLDDPHFYDDFRKQWGQIATPPGREEQFLYVHSRWFPPVPYPTMVLFAGLFAFGTACLLRHRARRSASSLPEVARVDGSTERS